MSTAWDTLLFRVASDLKNSLSLAVRKANQLLSCWFSRLAGLLSVFTETALAAASPKRVFCVAFHGPFSRISQNLVDSSKDRRSFFSAPRRFFDCASSKVLARHDLLVLCQEGSHLLDQFHSLGHDGCEAPDQKPRGKQLCRAVQLDMPQGVMMPCVTCHMKAIIMP